MASCPPTLRSVHHILSFVLTYTTNSWSSHWAFLFTTGRGRSTAACGRAVAERDTAGGPQLGKGVALGRRRA